MLGGHFDVEEVKRLLADFSNLVIRGDVSNMLEIKDRSKPISRRNFTADEEKWTETWAFQVWVVKSVDEALRSVGINTI